MVFLFHQESWGLSQSNDGQPADTTDMEIDPHRCNAMNNEVDCTNSTWTDSCCMVIKSFFGQSNAPTSQSNGHDCQSAGKMLQHMCTNKTLIGSVSSKMSCDVAKGNSKKFNVKLCCGLPQEAASCQDTEYDDICEVERDQNHRIEIESSVCCQRTLQECIDNVLNHPPTSTPTSGSTGDTEQSHEESTPQRTTPTTSDGMIGSSSTTGIHSSPPTTSKPTSHGMIGSSTTTTNNQEGNAEEQKGTGVLAGGVVGGLLGGVVITVVVVVVWWSCRRRGLRNQQTEARLSKETNTKPAVVPDVIKMSSSGLDADYHEYHVISESQSRKPETGDYADIKSEDLQGRDPGYEVAGGLTQMSSCQVVMEERNSTIRKNGYELAGGFHANSTGNQNPTVNDDNYNRLGVINSRPKRGTNYDKIEECDSPRKSLSADYFVLEDQGKQEIPTGRHDPNDNGEDYNRLGDSNNRPKRGTNYDKIGESRRREPDLAADYFVLEDQGDQEQYNRLGAPVTAVDGQDTYNRLGAPVTAVAGQDTYNRLATPVTAVDGQDTYNRLGAPVTAVAGQETYNRLAAPVTAVDGQDTYNRLAAPVTAVAGQDTYNRLAAPVTAVAGQETYNRLGEELEHGADDKQDNMPGDIQPNNEGCTYNRLGQENEKAISDIYNRLGQAGTDVTIDKQDHNL